MSGLSVNRHFFGKCGLKRKFHNINKFCELMQLLLPLNDLFNSDFTPNFFVTISAIEFHFNLNESQSSLYAHILCNSKRNRLQKL